MVEREPRAHVYERMLGEFLVPNLEKLGLTPQPDLGGVG